MNELKNGTNNRLSYARRWSRYGVNAFVIAVFTLVSNFSYGVECSTRVQPIRNGDTANCDGFLFSDEAEKDAAQSRDDAKYYKQLSEKLIERNQLVDKESEILQKRLQLYVTQSDILAEKLVKKDSEDFWQKALYFTFGAVLTGGIAYGVVKTLK